jgi:uncharacterized protein
MLAGVDADALIEKLGLEPLPIEGGCFLETYRTSYSTAIYYLLTAGTVSRIHRLASDEIFHFYAGDPVEMLMLREDGTSEVVSIGGDIESGQSPQVIVPKGVWQGCRLVEGGKWALMGTTVAPPFRYEDYEPADRVDLIRRYSDRGVLIRDLT